MTLKIENVTKKYSDKFALRNVCRELNEGIYGLLGPNGTERSTLMRILVNVSAIDKWAASLITELTFLDTWRKLPGCTRLSTSVFRRL